MPKKVKMGLQGLVIGIVAALSLVLFCSSSMVSAQIQQQQGDVTLNVTVTGSPPTIPAIITSPLSGTHVTTTPLVISGTCQPNLEVRVYNNGAQAGTGLCGPDGTFIINIGLLPGRNDLTVLNYDTFNRQGPASGVVSVFVDEIVVAWGGEDQQLTSGDSPGGSNKSGVRRSNIMNPVKKILGIDQSAGPISTTGTLVFLIVIALLAIYATDLTLFEASLSTRLVSWLKALKTLIKQG